ncbi:MAG: DUF484 family protein [Thiotrichaceae bacterium]|nr:DUF484 family protein [Thiotrichaceae bacterium]
MSSSSKLETKTADKPQISSVGNSKNNAEQSIIDYLQSHPDFFVHHSSLLANMDIAHNSGTAISLIERQVGILREQNAQQKIQLTELFYVANKNEQSNQKIHKLTLDLLASQNLNESEKALNKSLCENFSVDAISLRVFIEPKNKQAKHLFIEKGSKTSKGLEKLINTRKPQCGYFKNLSLNELFDENSEDLCSFAILPLFVEKNNCFGVLVLGSQNMRRFSADMGTVFLERMGESISHILSSFVKSS